MDEQQKQDFLRALGQQLEIAAPFILAFSGGLDSRFLAHIAYSSRLPFEAAHVQGPHIPGDQSAYALSWLEKRGIPVQRIQFDPLSLFDVQLNSKQRCYACKKAMLLRICHLAQGRKVLEGSNASDKSKFRPGLRAIEELGVISPLALCGLAKPQIITLAQATGLDNPTQPARPCLLTRFDYDLAPTPELLNKVAATEAEIASTGIKDFRLRLHQDKPALLQVAWDEAEKMEQKRTRLEQILAWHGFKDAEIQAEISLSGYFDLPK